MMAGRAGGPPSRQRHDGTSPLPLGMDASSAPVRWVGVSTVWPYDFRSGWSYCVMVPNWLSIPQATTADGHSINPTVFYRVQVGVQSPQGISTVRGILRRFSDFLKLHAAVKKVFPNKRLPAAPPKNALLRISSSQSLLQERRRALEEWIGKLLADIDISRSVPIASFLELEAAARYAVNTISEQQASSAAAAGVTTEYSTLPAAPSSSSSLSWTGAGNSALASVPFPSNVDYGSDATNDTPILGTSTKTSEGVLELEMEALALEQETAINKATDGATQSRHRQGSQLESTRSLVESNEHTLSGQPENLGTGAQGESGEVGMVDQRSASGLQHAFSSDSVAALHRRRGSRESLASDAESIRGSEPSVAPSMDGSMDTSIWHLGGVEDGLADSEFMLKSAGIVLPVDQRNKVRRVLMAMQRKLSVAKSDKEDLIARVNQETLVKEFLVIKVRDLEGELDNSRRKSREVLQQAVSLERDRVTSLQWELEECKTALMNLEETSGSEKDTRMSLEEMVTRAEAAKEIAIKEVADLRVELAQVQKERDVFEAQARADKKVLVKEVKSLRTALAENNTEIESARRARLDVERALDEERQRGENAQALTKKFLHEVITLRRRLRECTVDYLAREDEKLPNKSAAMATDAMDLLSTSDNRIGLLVAETQLVAQQGRGTASTGSRLPNGVHSNGSIPAQTEKSRELCGDGEDSELALQQLVTDLIIDNAQLLRAVNHSLTLSAVSSQRADKDSVDASTIRKSVLSKFLGAP